VVDRLRIGAPGVYERPEPLVRELTGVRMDVAAFVGVAPRGPAWVPVVNERFRDDVPRVEPGRPLARSVAVPVESWDDYRRVFGGFEGPGLLPYAVGAFFEQGGRRAYVVRVVARDPARRAVGVAHGTLVGAAASGGTPIVLHARDEGSWGNRLRATLTFRARPLAIEQVVGAELQLAPDAPLVAPTLLRFRLRGGTGVLRVVTTTWPEGRRDARGRVLRAILDFALPAEPEAVDVVEGTLEIDDGEGRRERHERLALVAGHPRWLATVLDAESSLLRPDAEWSGLEVLPAGVALRDAAASAFTGGHDRYAELEHEDFFAPDWISGDDPPGEGVHALVGIDDVSLLVVPDLYSPAPLVPVEQVLSPVSLAGAEFERCVEAPTSAEQAVAGDDLAGLRLDPTLPLELERIVSLQQRLVDLAETLASFVVLLDVPPGLHQRQILSWRSRFASAYAAAYHPWLRVSRLDDLRNALVRVNPSALAAGIVARREQLFGVPDGPANEVALGVVDVDERVSPQRHDELHPAGINVFLRERDGVRLTAARTLADDSAYRQLSVRRLMTMLRRVLEQQTQWVVFEPNNESLRADLRHLVGNYLARLFRANAFKGATEEEAFFVRCDESLNPRADVDAGRLIAEVGVAPAEPLEFLVLRIARDGDGTVRVEAARA
jgi:hypothetical protein